VLATAMSVSQLTGIPLCDVITACVCHERMVERRNWLVLQFTRRQAKRQAELHEQHIEESRRLAAEVKAKARREQQMEKERVERYRQFKGAPPPPPPGSASAARCMRAARGGGRLGGGGGGGGAGSWAGAVPGSEGEGGSAQRALG
jgi:hypothetical protein